MVAERAIQNERDISGRVTLSPNDGRGWRVSWNRRASITITRVILGPFSSPHPFSRARNVATPLSTEGEPLVTCQV